MEGKKMEGKAHEWSTRASLGKVGGRYYGMVRNERRVGWNERRGCSVFIP